MSTRQRRRKDGRKGSAVSYGNHWREVLPPLSKQKGKKPSHLRVLLSGSLDSKVNDLILLVEQNLVAWRERRRVRCTARVRHSWKLCRGGDCTMLMDSLPDRRRILETKRRWAPSTQSVGCGGVVVLVELLGGAFEVVLSDEGSNIQRGQDSSRRRRLPGIHPVDLHRSIAGVGVGVGV
jgi:hypothetical protein